MTVMQTTVICPNCGADVTVDVTATALSVEVEGQPSLIIVAAPTYSHTCPTTPPASPALSGEQ